MSNLSLGILLAIVAGVLNGSFATLGYFIIGIFALSWIVSIAIYKWRRLDELEIGG